MYYNQGLSHGFGVGVNDISMTKILKWVKVSYINWNAFLWYISDYCKIIDCGVNWFKVELLSDKQLHFIYSRIIEYNAEMCEHNYTIDKQSDLWKTHKISKTSKEILTKIINN